MMSMKHLCLYVAIASGITSLVFQFLAYRRLKSSEDRNLLVPFYLFSRSEFTDQGWRYRNIGSAFLSLGVVLLGMYGFVL